MASAVHPACIREGTRLEEPHSILTLLDEDYATVGIISIFGAQSNGPALAVGGPRTMPGSDGRHLRRQSACPDLQRTGDCPDLCATYRMTDDAGWILCDIYDGLVDRILVARIALNNQDTADGRRFTFSERKRIDRQSFSD